MADHKHTQFTPLIAKDILIAEMVEKYPQVIEYLVMEYGFHCVSCFISGFEHLEAGAAVHGITGQDFEEMWYAINDLAAGTKEYDLEKGLVAVQSDLSGSAV